MCASLEILLFPFSTKSFHIFKIHVTSSFPAPKLFTEILVLKDQLL